MFPETDHPLDLLPAPSDSLSGERMRRGTILFAWFNPLNQFRWLLGFLQSWLLSRDYARLTSSIPFWILIVTVVFLTWLRHAPDDAIVSSYEAALEAAVSRNDSARQDVYLNALVQLRPRDPEVRFQLARFLLGQGRQEGLDFLSPLVPNNTDGYAPARMWLVEQASRRDPVVPLSDSQIEGQLTRILSTSPDDPSAHRALARLLLRKSDFKGAERHLENAARVFPELSVEVARLKSALQRNPDDIRRYAARGADVLTAHLQTHPDDVDTRLALADAQVLLGQFDAARELLTAGVDRSKDQRLQRSLADLEVGAAQRRLAESELNRDACRGILLNALKLDPSSLAAIQSLAELSAAGIIVDRELIQETLDHWQQQLNERQNQEEPRRVLSQLLAMVGASAEAAEVLRPLVSLRPELRLPLARLLVDAGAADEAPAVLQPLELQASLELMQNPQSVTAAVLRAESFMITGQPREALNLLEKLAIRNQTERIPQDPSLRAIFGRASIQLYDSIIPPGAEPTDTREAAQPLDYASLLQLLADAVASPVTIRDGMDRLARLALSKHPAAAQAEELTRQYRLSETSEQEMLNRIGTQALTIGDYPKARTCLEQVNQLSRGRNPMVLNNLAIALARGEPRNLTRALELANQALLLIPGNPDVLSTRGEILLESGRWSEAIQDLEQAIPLRRDSREVHELLLRGYTATNAIQQADAHRREIERIDAGPQR